MSRVRSWSAVLGVALLLAYAGPVYWPPAATAPAAPGPNDPLFARIFPGVPPWWVWGRLLCLAGGAALLAMRSGARFAFRFGSSPAAAPHVAAAAADIAGPPALLAAVLLAIAGLFAAHFGRAAETVYFLALAVPAILTARGERDALSAMARRARRCWPIAVLPLVWVAVALPPAWRAPRAANLVDMWVLVERLERVAAGQQQILADSTGPGHTNAYMMFEGAPLLGPERIPVSFVGLQIAHAAAGVTCALVVGAIAWMGLAPAAAPVAQAALLFSPYGLSALYEPAPMLFTATCTALLLLLLLVRRTGSRTALVLFGTAAGLSATDPPAVLVALLLCAFAAVVVGRLRPVPWWAVATAVCAGAAVVAPSPPTPQVLRDMIEHYTLGRAQLAGIVAILFGQQSPYDVVAALRTGRAGPLDLPLGSLLAPFAIARTPLRIWGDVLFDPLAAALLAVGIAAGLRAIRRSAAAAGLLALVLAGLVGGFTAEGDAVSHTRLAPVLVPLALLTASGFETARASIRSRWQPARGGWLMAALIAASGLVLFFRVTPAIEPGSWMAISLEALGTRAPSAPATFLTYDEPRERGPDKVLTFRWLYVDSMARLLPRDPMPARTASALTTEIAAADAPARIYFWSPALEQDAAIARAICRRWPGAALYTLTDAPGIYRALAADPRGAVWRPRLPAERWTVRPCAPER
jgi:hypothetical protein